MSFPDNDYYTDDMYTDEQKRVIQLFECFDGVIAMWCKLQLQGWEEVKFHNLPEEKMFEYAERYGIK